jgi:NhaA family Na+:H+ antiporter
MALNNSIGIGVIAGLVIGKPVGVFLFSRVLVGLKIAHLPRHVYWKQFLGMGTLAGIGFTMSIFTTSLAFTGETHREVAKIAILISMILSLVISWMYFLIIGQIADRKSATISATEIALS